MAAVVGDSTGITFEAAAGGGVGSFSLGVGATSQKGVSRAILVFAFMRSNTSSPSVSSLTCDGAAMTKLAAASLVNQYTSGQWINVETWYALTEPPNKDSGQTWSLEGTFNMTLPLASVVMAKCVLNVNPRGWQGLAATNSGNSTNPNVTLTGKTAGSFVVFAAAQRRDTGGAYDSSAAFLDEYYDGETGSGTSGDMTYYLGGEGPVGAGNATYGPTRSSSAQWTAVAVELLKSEESIPLIVPRRRQMALVRL
mgnify:CR=1 FL=1